MECRDAERLIDAYLDGELSAETTRQLESHVAECTVCQLMHGPLLKLLCGPRPVSVPDGLRERIVTAVAESASKKVGGGFDVARGRGRARPFPLRWTPWMGAVAAALVFFAMGWISSQLWVKTPGPVPEQAPTPPREPVTIVLSPWALNSLAQAMALRGPGNPMVFLAQAAVTELLTTPSVDPKPVVRVRLRRTLGEPVPPDANLPPPEMLFFTPLYRPLGV